MRTANTKKKEKIFTCSKYNKYGAKHCSQHRIDSDGLYRLVLEQIRHYARLALRDEEEVRWELMTSYHAEEQAEKEIIEHSIAEDSERIGRVERIISRLYDDMIAGKINEDNFERMMQKS